MCVAGNVRRTAEIVFGDPHSEEYLDLKNYKVNPHRDQYGWTSNNSVFAELGMDYSEIAKRIVDNGELWPCLVRQHEKIFSYEEWWR